MSPSITVTLDCRSALLPLFTHIPLHLSHPFDSPTPPLSLRFSLLDLFVFFFTSSLAFYSPLYRCPVQWRWDVVWNLNKNKNSLIYQLFVTNFVIHSTASQYQIFDQFDLIFNIFFLTELKHQITFSFTDCMWKISALIFHCFFMN